MMKKIWRVLLFLICLIIFGLLVLEAIPLFQKIPDWIVTTVVICVCVISTLLSIGFMWRMYRRKYPEKKVTSTPPSGANQQKKDLDWKLPVVVVGCEIFLILVCHDWFWPLLWGFFGIWFLVFNLVGITICIFCREPKDKKKADGEKKISTVGKLILAAMIIAFVINNIDGQTTAEKAASVKRIVSSFGNLPKENEKLKVQVMKFWQDNLPNDLVGRQKMLDAAGQTNFNQFSTDKTPLRREVSGGWKVGVMGIDERLWAEVGNDFDIADSADDNLKVALYLYQNYGDLPWSSFLTKDSRLVVVPATGWSEQIPLSGRRLHLQPSGEMTAEDDRGRKYQIGTIAGRTFLTFGGKTSENFPFALKWIKYSTDSGKPGLVLVTPLQ